MKKIIQSLILASVFLFYFETCFSLEQWSFCEPDKQPIFSDFSVPSDFYNDTKIQPKLKLKSSFSKKFRTVIANASKDPSDFSGFFKVAIWGCGSDCRQFAIINKRNGFVYTNPTVRLVAGVMGNTDPRIGFQKNSRLFIISGVINDIDSTKGKYYYQWVGDYLIPICMSELQTDAFSEK